MGRDNTDLPPLPAAGQVGPEVCIIVRLYLAVIDDLPLEQVQLLKSHIVTCTACRQELRMLGQATRLVSSSAHSAPSPRVDKAIRSLIESQPIPQQPAAAFRRVPQQTRTRRLAWIVGELLAAALVLALIASTHFFGLFGGASAPKGFALPASLSWSQYVLFHSETRTGSLGEVYQIESYHDLGTGAMHVETKMANQLDVVAVSDGHDMLGMDMIHHVAEMGAQQWSVDDSTFNLDTLRHDLLTGSAVYLGTTTFQGKTVYRILSKDGFIMLLDKKYFPVNLLHAATGKPVYTALQFIPSSQVSSSMWNMSVPQGYHMGTLPAKP
jgi:hypothetical protein